ncbi:MAG: outer membrane protein assembly factor BamD [Candidatus Thiodiazotropha sp.]|nr:outer membrane protein assembly factor BamD [Candidatus Thiodiazotropha sp.]MCM8883529.1 outer membrane protein assembly factor BamD [Candidatus Thiodiazotropha sp.]MCM8919076.1 outer membrane protein assembly factor BamD [Candidatus Thiodiazotropha sp.]MCU7873399.1 outer membrane protein assembly factor BamD [Candidatus Thiodiazotropha sp. (ex Lucinoma borealis)]MCU7875784.1 outer membrane protein assembly factor BamD [Candidatus Thiodiazotropha sp. (ex Lucinoma borealis)]
MSWKRLIIILTTLLLAGCSLPDQIDVTKDWSASQFYSEAKTALMDGQYDEAIKNYNGLQARFPFGRYATQSQLDIIYAHYKNGEPDSAIAAADRFIKLNPQSPFVDYAYFMKGLANYNRNQSIFTRILPTDPSERDAGAALDAFNDFAELVRRYPNSKYSADAHQRMLYLRNNLAKYQIHIAKYYMRRGAYLAAANRANRVVTHFQRTDAVQGALEIMIDAYNRLGMTELADDAKRVLTLNLTNGRLNTLSTAESEDEK